MRLLTGIAGALLCGGVALGAETRDPAQWPFDAKSPWNHPIGSEAVYEPIEKGLRNCVDPSDQYNMPVLNVTRFSINLYRATADDPIGQLQTWYPDRANGDQCFEQIHVPVDAVPSDGSDAHLSIIDPAGEFVYELGAVRRVESPDFPAGYLNGWLSFKNDLRGMGVYPLIHGTRASGVSSLGGLIRKGELLHGIPHALALATNRANLNSHAPNGRRFVWPACSSDYEMPGDLFPLGGKPYEDWYGKEGNLYIGTLLAIPPEVDLTQIGIQVPGPTYEIAKALQNYGAYVADMGGAPFVLFAEHAAAEDLGGTEALNDGGGTGLELAKLLPYLRVVANNGPERIGGGGEPRAPFAPPFARERE